MENRTRFGLDKMDAELVNDILPVGINLPKNQKPLLATLMYINGIDKKDEDGFFYVDNKYLMEVLGVSEPTIISNANKLIEAGFIVRKSGKKNHPSKYMVTDLVKDFTKKYTKDLVNYTKDFTKKYTKDLAKYTKDFSKTNTKDFSKTIKNFRQDKEQDKDIDKEKEIDKDKINKYINNIIEKVELREKEIFEKIDSRLELKFSEMMRMLEDKLNLLQDASTKTFSTSIETSTNTEKTNTDMNTNVELTKIEELQIKNAKLNERLDNCARQFKKMMQTIEELQQKVSELETKMNQTSTNETSTKQDKSDSKPSNPSNLTTTKEDEEKPIESNSEASMAIVEDADADFVYGLFTSAVEACTAANAYYDSITLLTYKKMILDDIDQKNVSYRVRKEVEDRIDKFIQDFNEKSDSKPSNPSSGTTTHQEEEKPTASSETALNQIVEVNTTPKNDECYEEEEDFDNFIKSLNDDEEDASIDDVTTVQEKSDSKPSNPSSGTTTHQEDLKPIVAQQMPSTAIVDENVTPKEEEKQTDAPKKTSTTVVEDVDVDKEFKAFTDGVEQFEEMYGNCEEADLNSLKTYILQNLFNENASYRARKEVIERIDKYINEYIEKTSRIEENTSSGTTTKEDEEKPTVASETALNQIVEVNTTPKVEEKQIVDGYTQSVEEYDPMAEATKLAEDVKKCTNGRAAMLLIDGFLKTTKAKKVPEKMRIKCVDILFKAQKEAMLAHPDTWRSSVA